MLLDSHTHLILFSTGSLLSASLCFLLIFSLLIRLFLIVSSPIFSSYDQIDDSMIAHLKIPNGIPLVYTMDEKLNPILDYTDDLGFQANYLVSARNHGKVSNSSYRITVLYGMARTVLNHNPLHFSTCHLFRTFPLSY